jgi:hypothetical protein
VRALGLKITLEVHASLNTATMEGNTCGTGRHQSVKKGPVLGPVYRSACGSIAAGKAADLVILARNPAAHVEDVGNVEAVFEDGLGHNPAKLTQSMQGLVSLR